MMTRQVRLWGALALLSCTLGPAIPPVLAESTTPENQSTETVSLDPVPFAANAVEPVWRIGFRPSEHVYLLEVRPDDKAACDEKDALVDEYVEAYGSPENPSAIVFPFSKATRLKGLVVNPQKWTIIDMRGDTRELSFTQLAANNTEANSGCWYLGTMPLDESDRRSCPSGYPDECNLIFGIAREMKEAPKISLPVVNITDDPHFLPKGYSKALRLPKVKAFLGVNYEKFRSSVATIHGNAVRATLSKGAKRQEIFWLLQWRTNQNPTGYEENVWGLFKVVGTTFMPLFLSKLGDDLTSYDNFYGVEIVAALDLDGDGVDEIVIKATQYEGSEYLVLALKEGRFRAVYASFYYGL